MEVETGGGNCSSPPGKFRTHARDLERERTRIPTLQRVAGGGVIPPCIFVRLTSFVVSSCLLARAHAPCFSIGCHIPATGSLGFVSGYYLWKDPLDYYWELKSKEENGRGRPSDGASSAPSASSGSGSSF